LPAAPTAPILPRLDAVKELLANPAFKPYVVAAFNPLVLVGPP
jgi:hypothetical protein